MSDTLGMLTIKTQIVESASSYYRQIVGAMWDGPPVAMVGEDTLYQLPDFAFSKDGELVQIGEYVMRRTGQKDFAMRAEYVYLVDGGLAYWLWWRMCQHLQFAWTRIILTLAVWGLSAWPKDGTVPSWADVMRRWRK